MLLAPSAFVCLVGRGQQIHDRSINPKPGHICSNGNPEMYIHIAHRTFHSPIASLNSN